MKKILLVSTLVGIGLLSGCQSSFNSDSLVFSNNDYQNEVISESIYESMYATDTDPRTLLEVSTNCFEGKIVSILSSEVDEFGNIRTPLEVEVMNQYKGDISSTVIVYQNGGSVDVGAYNKVFKKIL